MQALAGRVEVWRPLLHVDPENRWYTRVAGGDGWEAWLLTWLPGQRTGLHDHGPSAGAFTVLAGQLEEITAVHRPSRGSDQLKTRTLAAPDVRAFSYQHVHEVIGAGTGPAASLHVYAPELTVMNRYDLDAEGRLRLVRSERAGRDW